MDNKSAHFNGKNFFNPTLGLEHKKSFWQGLKMWCTTPKATWPKFVANTATPNLPPDLEINQIAVTFVNHVTFLLQLPGLNILTDPHWSKRCSPLSWFGPQRVRKPGIEIDALPEIDLILISHNHYDHLDQNTLKTINKKFAPKIFVPKGDSRVLDPKQFNLIELDWWNEQTINPITKINFTPMQHWSNRGLFDLYASLWGSYVIEHNGKRIFFGGDGGYCQHFSAIQQKFGAMDLSFIGIGAYEPRWFMKDMHTNPEEAVQAHLDLQSKISIGMHFGTFQLSAEGFEQPLIDLRAAKQKHNISDQNFTTLSEGETRVFSL